MRRPELLLTLAALALVVAGCGDDEAPAGAGTEVAVVTTTTQLTDFARIVGGSHVRVFGVLKANVDPHDYEPSPADLEQIGDADLVVKNGVGLESWFDDTITSAEPKGEIVDASEGVVLRAGDGSEEEKAGDPHIWHDPENAGIMVATITTAFVRVDPAHADDYERNAARYRRQLGELDADIKRRIATLTNRKLVTNHDAFGYYVDHYGLDFVGSVIPSFDSQAELSARDISELVTRIRSTGVKAIFSESSLPPKTAEAIGAEAGVEVVAGEDALYGDSLGPPGSDGGTYLKMQRHNTREIVDNLR